MRVKPEFLLYGIDTAFEASRMMVGSISAVYLMSKGASLADLATIKAVQGAVLMSADLPTGILADRYGWRKSLLLATASGAAGFMIYYFGASISLFLVAEIFAALAICFWSGAYEAFALDQLRKNSDTSAAIEHFFHMNNSVTTGGVVLAGLLSSLIAMFSLDAVYLVAALTMAVLAGVLVVIPTRRADARHATERPHWSEIIKTLRRDLLTRSLLPFIAGVILIQFFMQPLLHYWQPLFTKVTPAVSSKNMGLVFSAYCAAQSLASYFMARAVRSGFRPGWRILWAMVSLTAACYISMGQAANLVLVLGAFMVAQATFAIVRSRFTANVAQSIHSRSRASALSALSLLSRTGMLTSLATLGAFFAHERATTGMEVVAPAFSIYGVGLALTAVVYLMWRVRCLSLTLAWRTLDHDRP